MPRDPSNPLASPSALPFELPDWARIRTEHFQPAIEAGMDEQLALLGELASDPEPATVANVIEAWERSGRAFRRALNAFEAKQLAATDDALDAVEEAIRPKVAAHADAIWLDADLYQRVRALAARVDAGEVSLDAQDRHWLERTLLAFQRAGVGLAPAEQERLRALNARIAQAQSEFRRLGIAGRAAAAVLVSDADQLAGLGAADVAAARQLATEHGHASGWLIALESPSGQSSLGVLRDRALRERIHRASLGRGFGGAHDTRALVVELARCRAERAALRGFGTHADYVAAAGCAGTREAVWDLLTGLAPRAVAQARADAAQLESAWRGIEPQAPMAPWDWLYVSELVRAERHTLDGGMLRPYLELERVLHAGVFASATALYGITLTERGDLVGYHPEVRVFQVDDVDGEPLGLLLADVHTRPGKSGGAWSGTLVEQNDLLDQRTVVFVELNVPRPASGQPVLLRWEEVETLFHEFGHALHALLSATRYPSRSGMTTPQDFVEYPSQVHEVWALDPALLAGFARHHQTDEPMPAQWLDTLRASSRFQQGYATTESVAVALLDQAWHSTPLEELPTGPDGVADFERQALASVGLDDPLVPPRYRSTYMSHVFGGWGYDAALYSYLWSDMLAADTAAFFAAGGGLTRENGERFRRRLLARGGSIDSMDAYRDYRGGDPDPAHLLARLGFAAG